MPDHVVEQVSAAIRMLYPEDHSRIGAQATASLDVKANTSDEGDCLKWRCWKCKKVWPSSQKCQKCGFKMDDYKGDDLMEILVLDAPQEVQDAAGVRDENARMSTRGT